MTDYAHNMRLLADKLAALPADYAHFAMDRYNNQGCPPEEVTTQQLHTCGTSACALGHAPVIPGLQAWPNEYWEDYCQRLFGFQEYSPEWDFVFGPFWDNDPADAAARLNYLADNGSPPDEWGDRTVDDWS